MKNFFAFFAAATLMVSLVGCEKPLEGPHAGHTKNVIDRISGKIANMEDLPPSEEYVVVLHIYDPNISSNVEIASTPLAADGSFSVEMPRTVPEDQMNRLGSLSFLNEAAWLDVSDREVGVASAELGVYADGHYVATILSLSPDADIRLYRILFADGDFNAIGTTIDHGDRLVYDMHFGRGWNREFLINEYGDIRNITLTTQVPDVKMAFFASTFIER